MKKAKTYNIPFFIPMFPHNAEFLYETEEVYAYLRSHNLRIEDDHIDYLVKRGIVGRREIKGRGKGQSVKGRWSLPHRELLREALTLEQHYKAPVVDLCILPVSKWLYWGDPADIELEQIKRAMQTWASYHYKRTQRSYERMKREITHLLQTVGHPDAVEKRVVGEQMANWFYNGQRPEEETLQEYLLPIIDPDRAGAARGPQGAPFSAEAVSHLLTARLTAIEQMIKRQVPDAFWEWARAFYLVSVSAYQQKQPTLFAEVANDKEVAPLFQANRVDQWCSSACYELAQVIGIGLLNPTPSTLPQHWHPAIWVQKKIVGRVSTVQVPSPLYGPSGLPIMHLHTRVSFGFPPETRHA